jgi:lipopolysaccharide export system permease protein
VMPGFGVELAKSHDDDGQRAVKVSTRIDARGLIIHGKDADRASRTITPFESIIPVTVFGSSHLLKGSQGTYIPPDHPTAPVKGGWLVRDAVINLPLDDEDLKTSQDVLCRVDDLTGFPPPYTPAQTEESQPGPAAGRSAAPQALLRPYSEIPYLASLPPYPSCATPALFRVQVLLDRKIDLSTGTYFLKSGLTFQAVTRKATWYQFARTFDLIEGLTDPSTEGSSERSDVEMFVHTRILRPVLGLNLLFMSLPLVLGGYGRNTFINLGFALANSAIFYGAIILCQYLGSFNLLSPVQAAWAPLFVFGTIATLRWGQIRT